MISTDQETSSRALAVLVSELGLEADIRQARRELASQIEAATKKRHLKVLRLRAGLSQAELAEALGISQCRMSNLESGREGMNPEFARELAGILGVNLDTLTEI